MNEPRAFRPSDVGMGRKRRLVHFVGIGGIGMSGIAEVLINLGYGVRGSDVKDTDVVQRLARMGADVRRGHAAANIEGVDVVVVSSAVRANNPEVIAARNARIPVIQRAEMLAELMRLKFGIAIAGTHGKTTTTSMVAAILGHAGLDPTVVVGGKINQLESNAKLGLGPYLVAEADESDGSFLHLGPTVAVVTNVDPEHLDHYRGGMPEIEDAFLGFINRVPFYGLAVICTDHPVLARMRERFERRTVSYGLGHDADFCARDLRFSGPKTTFSLVMRGIVLGDVDLSMLGEHNVKNALAALAVADELGISFRTAQEALAHFAGVDRRFSLRGEVDGVLVFDDYGHHPVEIRATLRGAKTAYPGRRIVAVFQPHRFTRTRDLLDDFANAFSDADHVFLCPIYAAGEDPIPNVTSKQLLDRMNDVHKDKAILCASLEDAAQHTATSARAGDLIVTLGAGDITKAATWIVAALQVTRKRP